MALSRREVGNLSNFPSLNEMLDENKSILPTAREEIMTYLEMLSKAFDEYFVAGELKTSGEWIMDPHS